MPSSSIKEPPKNVQSRKNKKRENQLRMKNARMGRDLKNLRENQLVKKEDILKFKLYSMERKMTIEKNIEKEEELVKQKQQEIEDLEKEIVSVKEMLRREFNA